MSVTTSPVIYYTSPCTCMFYVLRTILFRVCRYFTGLCSSNIHRYFLDFACQSAMPSKSNKLRHVNTMRWESWNIITQPGGIDGRESEVMAFVVNAGNNSTTTPDVPRLPSHGINVSQLIRFARCCTSV